MLCFFLSGWRDLNSRPHGLAFLSCITTFFTIKKSENAQGFYPFKGINALCALVKGVVARPVALWKASKVGRWIARGNWTKLDARCRLPRAFHFRSSNIWWSLCGQLPVTDSRSFFKKHLLRLVREIEQMCFVCYN